MEENKILEETVETVVDQVNEETVDHAVEAGKAVIDAAKDNDIWSVIFIILLAIGLIASGGWVVVVVIKIVKKIKAKKAAKLDETEVFVDDLLEEEDEETK